MIYRKTPGRSELQNSIRIWGRLLEIEKVLVALMKGLSQTFGWNKLVRGLQIEEERVKTVICSKAPED